jgi:hypothetical protein
MKLIQPFRRHLRITQFTQSPEEFTRESAHIFPIRVWIDFLHRRGDGTAVPERNPEVMYVVRRWISTEFCDQIQRSPHPEREAAILDGNTGWE